MKAKKSAEETLHDAYEKGEFVSTSPSSALVKKLQRSAQATFIKDRRVNIRLSSPDLMDIRARAAEEGVPYQTLISSVLHKYVSGRFVEKTSRSTKNSRQRGA